MTGFEEPENGVNPRRVQLIAERIKSHTRSGEKQMIVTTHSTLLADLMPDEALYVCSRKDGRTVIKPYRSCLPLFRQTEIGNAMDAEDVPISTRILRGDLDA